MPNERKSSGPYVPRGRQLEAPRQVDQPEPGFFKIREVRGGPYVAARIYHEPARDPQTGEWLDRSPWWRAEINGRPCGNASPDPIKADGVMRIWTFGVRINKREYEHLLNVKNWAKRHRPDLPEANPRAQIDLNKMKPIF